MTARDLLGTFEFELLDQPYEADTFLVDGNEATVIAKDGSGGEFALTQDALVFVSSEGQAGTLASNLDEFYALLLALPNWRDLCHYSGGGKLQELKRAEHALEKEDTSELANALQLAPAENAVETLHRNLTSKRHVFTTIGEGEFDSLFGSFTIDDLPTYKS